MSVYQYIYIYTHTYYRHIYRKYLYTYTTSNDMAYFTDPKQIPSPKRCRPSEKSWTHVGLTSAPNAAAEQRHHQMQKLTVSCWEGTREAYENQKKMLTQFIIVFLNSTEIGSIPLFEAEQIELWGEIVWEMEN